jgi:hypothetical protein
LETQVVALDSDHGVVHGLVDGGLLGAGLEVGPVGLGGHPKNVLGLVFVRVFGIGPGVVALPGEELGAVSKVLEMYLRKMKPRTTCLYSAASMLLRSMSAASQSLASRPLVAVLGSLVVVGEVFRRAAMEMGERGAEWNKNEQQNGRCDK